MECESWTILVWCWIRKIRIFSCTINFWCLASQTLSFGGGTGFSFVPILKVQNLIHMRNQCECMYLIRSKETKKSSLTSFWTAIIDSFHICFLFVIVGWYRECRMVTALTTYFFRIWWYIACFVLHIDRSCWRRILHSVFEWYVPWFHWKYRLRMWIVLSLYNMSNSTMHNPVILWAIYDLLPKCYRITGAYKTWLTPLIRNRNNELFHTHIFTEEDKFEDKIKLRICDESNKSIKSRNIIRKALKYASQS